MAANILGKIPKLVGYYLLSESGANPFVPIGNTTLNRDKGIGEKAYIYLKFRILFDMSLVSQANLPLNNWLGVIQIHRCVYKRTFRCCGNYG